MREPRLHAGEAKWARRQDATRLVAALRHKAPPRWTIEGELRYAVCARERLDNLPPDVLALTAVDRHLRNTMTDVRPTTDAGTSSALLRPGEFILGGSVSVEPGSAGASRRGTRRPPRYQASRASVVRAGSRPRSTCGSGRGIVASASVSSRSAADDRPTSRTPPANVERLSRRLPAGRRPPHRVPVAFTRRAPDATQALSG